MLTVGNIMSKEKDQVFKYFFFFIELSGVTLVIKIIKVQGVQFYLI